MASSASDSLRLELQVQGENDGTWGDKQVTNMQILDAAIAGVTSVSTTGGDTTLTNVDYTNDQAKKAIIKITGTLTSAANIIIPNAERKYFIWNATSGSYAVNIKTSSGSAVEITQSTAAVMMCDGSNTITFLTPEVVPGTGAPATAGGAAASSVSVTATGNLTSTDVQAALAELQGDIDDINSGVTSGYQPLDQDLTDISGIARAKGTLIAGTSSAWSGLSAGTNSYALIADSAESAGVKWGVLPVAGGGTGSTTASAARTALGLAIGSDVQAYDSGITAIASLAKTDGNIIVGNGSAWVAESGATARASLGLTIGTHVQAYDADLAAIAAATRAKGALLVGNSSQWTTQTVGANDYVLIADSTQSTGVKWGSVSSLSTAEIPTGTIMLIYAANAPSGWTSVASNDYAIRVVSSGNGGTVGGSTAFSSVFTSRTIAEANLPSHTHTFSATSGSGGSHNHYMFNSDAGSGGNTLLTTNIPVYDGNLGNDASYEIKGTATAATLGLTSTASAHTHTVSGTSGSTGSGTAMDFAVRYYNVLMCSKD